MPPSDCRGRESISGRHSLAGNTFTRSKRLILCTVGMGLAVAAAHARDAADPLIDRFSVAAANGQCIENLTYVMIREHGPQDAAAIVRASLVVLSRLGEQQRALGCAGDIAAQAIAAGADPDAVLRATAAGL